MNNLRGAGEFQHSNSSIVYVTLEGDSKSHFLTIASKDHT